MMVKTVNQKLNRLVSHVKQVQRRLITLILLKTLAICFVWAALGAGLYAWLDHTFHLGIGARVAALIFLAISTVYLAIRFFKPALRYFSCSQVANYIESKIPLDQQLVTAIEYREQERNYPYSKSLAAYLVNQVDHAVLGTDLKSTVSKRQTRVFTGIILCGMLAFLFFLHGHYTFFSHYMQRLMQPLASIEPLPATQLVDITEDIMTTPDDAVTMTAEIIGKIPETGDLIIEATGTSIASGAESLSDQSNHPVYPQDGTDNNKLFESKLNLDVGEYRYRFEAGEAESAWHHISVVTSPFIASMQAEIFPPSKTGKLKIIKPIENNSLKIQKNAHVKITAKTTQEIDAATITSPDSETIKPSIQKPDTFEFEFNAKGEGIYQFQITSALGVTNARVPGLQILLMTDQEPSLELISPSGDCMTTNIASIPIIFTAHDDYGLDSMELSLQIGTQSALELPCPIDKGIQDATITHILELEDYDLTVGDSILFYAKTSDIETDIKPIPATLASDIHLIEIRPYEQIWHPDRASCPSSQAGNIDPNLLHDGLKSVLEYSRAILKKTWTIANLNTITEQNHKQMDSIGIDIEYTTEQIAMIRDDSRYAFSSKAINDLNGVIEQYDKAALLLSKYDPKKATEPETKAYQILRMLLIEMDRKLCPPGGGIPNKPDRFVIDENIHLTRYDSEKAMEECKQLADRLEQLHEKQKRINRSFDHFLAKPNNKPLPYQRTTDEKKWLADNDILVNNTSPSDSDSANTGQSPGAPPQTFEGAIGMFVGEANSSRGASSQERLQLLMAKQKSLRDELQTVDNEMNRLASQMQEHEEREQQDQIEDILKHIDFADERMKDFLDKLAQTFFENENNQSTYEQSQNALEDAEEQLELAAAETEVMATGNPHNESEETFHQYAKQLNKIANELERNPSADRKQELLTALNKAKQLYQSQTQEMDNPMNSGGDQGKGSGGISGNQQSSAIVVGNWEWDGLEPSETSRFLAMAFESLAISSKERKSALAEELPSDADFYRLEKEFYEYAARFDRDRK